MEKIGNITTSSKVIIEETAKVVISTFGVIGLSNVNYFSEGMSYLLKPDNYHNGIILKEENNELNLYLYVLLGFDFKLNIVLESIEQNIRWTLRNKYQVEFNKINIFINNIGRRK